MTTLMVIAHAPLASALRSCAAHVFPDEGESILVLDVEAGQSPDAVLEAAQLVLGAHAPALILTDIFGATPANTASKLADGNRCKVLAGVNLPMLLRALTYRNEPLDVLLEKAMTGGAQGILPVDLTTHQKQAKRAHDPREHHYQQ